MTDLNRLRRGYDAAVACLLSETKPQGTWEGELSSSPLSTATAIAALQLVQRADSTRTAEFAPLIRGGLQWLTECQNADGGWGDTVKSHSNISTATLVYASFHLVKSDAAVSSNAEPNSSAFAPGSPYDLAMSRGKEYVDKQGGFEAIRRRYGKDHTFSVPILTQCALAGLLPWNQLTPLPFELGSLPHRFYQWIHLPVVSYALPALIAIGQVRHYHQPSRNPLLRGIRSLAVKPTLRRLQSIQPESGGFLEATPLTSFVTMSLASMRLHDHPVARKGIEFLQASVRPDGSWPIDTNLATWVTTLSVNALRRDSITSFKAEAITDWLLQQQHRAVHRYTNAAPGGWAWTDLSGGVPDADDTPGAILALLKLNSSNPNLPSALLAGVNWLLDLQNRDGGWPTFCRGWGALPFDRSTPDLTAHTLRALHGWLAFQQSRSAHNPPIPPNLLHRMNTAVKRGFAFLDRTQRPDGTWFPLWFGNQFSSDEENPVYGVARVLAAYRDWNRISDPSAQAASKWLASVQNPDGGWGGAAETPSSTEETALATETLLTQPEFSAAASRGLDWLLEKVESKMFQVPAPIGLYFAKLWYFERLYPIIFTVSAFARAIEQADATNHALK